MVKSTKRSRNDSDFPLRLPHNPEVAGSSPASATRSSVHNQPESWMWTLDFFAYICVSLISGYSTSLQPAHDPAAPAFSRNPQQRRLHIFAAIAENRHTADEEGQAHPPSPVTKLNSWRMYIDESNWDRAAHRLLRYNRTRLRNLHKHWVFAAFVQISDRKIHWIST